MFFLINIKLYKPVRDNKEGSNSDRNNVNNSLITDEGTSGNSIHSWYSNDKLTNWCNILYHLHRLSLRLRVAGGSSKFLTSI